MFLEDYVEELDFGEDESDPESMETSKQNVSNEEPENTNRILLTPDKKKDNSGHGADSPINISSDDEDKETRTEEIDKNLLANLIGQKRAQLSSQNGNRPHNRWHQTKRRFAKTYLRPFVNGNNTRNPPPSGRILSISGVEWPSALPATVMTISNCPIFVSCASRCGVDVLWPIQRMSVPCIFSKCDILATGPAGIGKSYATFLAAVSLFLSQPSDRRCCWPQFRGIAPEILVVTSCSGGAALFSEILEKLGLNSKNNCPVWFDGGRQSSIESPSTIRLVVGTPVKIREVLEAGQMRLNDVAVLILDDVSVLFENDFGRTLDLFRMKFGLSPVVHMQTVALSRLVSAELRRRFISYLRADYVEISVAVSD